MRTVLIKHLKKDWKTILGSFVTIFVSIVLLSSFAILIFSTSKNTDPKAEFLMVVFFSMLGMVCYATVFSLLSVLKLSLKLRYQDLRNLRILGASINQIKLMILCENLVLFLIGIIFALPLSPLVSRGMLNFLVNSNAAPTDFVILKNFVYNFLGCLPVLAMILLGTWMSTSEINKISISESKNPFRSSKLSTKIVATIFGVLFLSGWIFLVSFKPILQAPVGIPIITGAVFCYIIGFSCLARSIILAILKILRLFFKKTLITAMGISVMLKNSNRIVAPITIMAMLMVFVSLVANVEGIAKIAFPEMSEQNSEYNSTVQTLLFIVFAVYGVIVVSNALQSYLFDKKRTYKEHMILGMSKLQIVMMNLIEMFFIIIFGFLFGNGAGILINVLYSNAIGIETVFVYNWPNFWISTTIVVLVIILNYAFALGTMFIPQKKSS